MDLVAVLRYYVDKMLKYMAGMKVLVLDAETTEAVSTLFSQSEILEAEVFLVENTEAIPGQILLHLKVRMWQPCLSFFLSIYLSAKHHPASAPGEATQVWAHAWSWPLRSSAE